jgi:predicted phosphodiesterase
MRCLVVADLHYSLPQFDWLLSAAPQFDLVIFAGDALDVGSAVDFRARSSGRNRGQASWQESQP